MLGNEGRCCDAVLRLLERRTAASRADLHLPDKSGGDSPRVGLCVGILYCPSFSDPIMPGHSFSSSVMMAL